MSCGGKRSGSSGSSGRRSHGLDGGLHHLRLPGQEGVAVNAHFGGCHLGRLARWALPLRSCARLALCQRGRRRLFRLRFGLTPHRCLRTADLFHGVLVPRLSSLHFLALFLLGPFHFLPLLLLLLLALLLLALLLLVVLNLLVLLCQLHDRPYQARVGQLEPAAKDLHLAGA